MCGIVGYVGNKQVVPLIIDGLRKLEYRGYDSAGIAVVNEEHELQIRRAEGKLRNLEEAIRLSPLDGTYGIGHTRWATHGRPTEENAHPHRDCTGRVVVVHNGIIENYLQLKERLRKNDHRFVTETDTEILAHLIEEYLKNGDNFEKAVRDATKDLRGIFALSIVNADEADTIIAVRQGPPVVIGLGDGEYFVASDIPPILQHTRDVFFLGDGEIAVLTKDAVRVTDFDGSAVKPSIQRITWDPIMAEKGGFKHFMLKEIYEQPRSVRDTVQGRISLDSGRVFLDEMKNITEADFKKFTSIKIAACGTSWHAALAGKYMIEQLARIPVEVDYASEFRYRNPIIRPEDVMFVISQSGETADTLAAFREAKDKGATVLGIVNVVGSTIARETEGGVYIHAGPEIGVASTKAFTSQIAVLSLITLLLARHRGLSAEQGRTLAADLMSIPGKIASVLKNSDHIKSIAEEFKHMRNFLYLGRGSNFPTALEGALKLKEISYIHAEGYPAAEMKHGPIALIDEDMPVVFVVPKDAIYDKVVSNMQEVRARKGRIIAIANEDDTEIDSLAEYVIRVPRTYNYFGPIVNSIPLQLLAYHMAVARGCDVDQPRNLAKSVTVE